MSDRVAARRPSPAAWLLIWPIRFYQLFISRYTPATCRYYPCCSSYAIGALRTHGAAKGLILTGWRLLRCNPWSSGGVDHVPPRGSWRTPVAADATDPAMSTMEDLASAPTAERSPADGRSVTDLSGATQPTAAGASIAGRTAA